jgi:hypothetical protein
MMIQLLVRSAPRVLAFAAMVFAAAGPVRGAQVSLPAVPVQILGADSLCTSWTLGGTAGAPTLTCVTGGGPAPFSCALTGAPSGSIASGTAVSLTMNCGGGTAPYSYVWTPGNSTAASLSTNPTATTTYSVTARDNANGSTTQSATVTVSTGGGGGGGGGGAISCSGFTNTVVLDINWNSPVDVRASSLSQTDAVVVRIALGAGPGYGKISAAEFGGISATRYASLSTSACDFREPPALGWGAGYYGSSGDIIFANGPDAYGIYPSFATSTTAYLNLKTTGACGSNCAMLFHLTRY